MGPRSTTTAVEIFGSVYYVRGGDSEALRQLAQVVDQKMREVAERVTTVDSAKVAIMAAMNLADELARCKKSQEGERDGVLEKVEELAIHLEQVLQS
jgi:cell division protein ZapA